MHMYMYMYVLRIKKFHVNSAVDVQGPSGTQYFTLSSIFRGTITQSCNQQHYSLYVQCHVHKMSGGKGVSICRLVHNSSHSLSYLYTCTCTCTWLERFYQADQNVNTCSYAVFDSGDVCCHISLRSTPPDSHDLMSITNTQIEFCILQFFPKCN